jgi:hypothetical protein
MKLVPLYTIFDIKYGNSLELINLQQCLIDDADAINYVSRTEKNNGVSAFVKRTIEYEENAANTISVAVSGSVLSTFLQPKPYYTGFHIFVLTPKREMDQIELLFYCQCIKANKYKYNYGRQANRTLKDILIPNRIPNELKQISLETVTVPDIKSVTNRVIDIDTDKWEFFELDDLFTLKKGKRLTKEDMEVGETPFIAAIDSNNGWRQFIDQPALHSGNTITVNYNGSVAESFYQPVPFWASDDVNVLYPKFQMSIYMAVFIITVIKQEKYRFNFGRKWHLERMSKSAIKLPSVNNKPDFSFMEKFIKSLPFSASLDNEDQQKAIVKTVTKGKELTDLQLIEKYEAGSIDIKKQTIKMLQPNPTAVKSDKQKSKVR